MRRVALPALVALALLPSAPAAPDAPARGGCPPAVPMPSSWPDDWDELEEDAVEAINRLRERGARCRGRQRGPVGPLDMDGRLREAARRQTRYMALHRVWSHDAGGCDPFTWIRERGYEGRSLGQNLGRRQGANSGELAVASWLASGQGHCEALMDPRWRSVGVAYVRAGATHLWTANFGDQ